MRRLTALALFAVAAALWSGCPEDPGGDDAGPDSGPGQDAGRDGGVDAGVDAGTDAGADSGTGSDAGTDAGTDGGTDAGMTVPQITAADQTLSTLSTLTTVASVTATQQGWVTISVPASGGGTEIAGLVAVPAGATNNLSVWVDRPIQDQWQVTFTLYRDLGTVGVYEPLEDTVVLDGSSNPVEATAVITVAANTPAVRYTFTNSGFSAWTIAPFPLIFLSTLSSSGTNPTLTLHPGWRYEMVANGGSLHPLQFVTLGATPVDDVLLLGQGSASGSLEGDGTVAWTDTGAGGTSRFTVSAALSSAPLTGYRCQNHGSMRSTITIQ